MNIILLAPPAAGKGTQAELLTEEYKLNHISTGDLLREASQEQNEFGNKLKTIMESGNLVSDETVLEVLNRYLDKTDNFNLLLDGFPRNIYQAEQLDKILAKKNQKVDYVFLLNVDKDTLLYRYFLESHLVIDLNYLSLLSIFVILLKRYHHLLDYHFP